MNYSDLVIVWLWRFSEDNLLLQIEQLDRFTDGGMVKEYHHYSKERI
jgi:hypothetical protein